LGDSNGGIKSSDREQASDITVGSLKNLQGIASSHSGEGNFPIGTKV